MNFCFSIRSYFNTKTAGGQLISVKMKNVTRKLKDYYKLSSAKAVVLKKYSERGGDQK